MSKINKFNEFVNNDELLIKKLIEDAENTNLPDLEMISKRESYINIINIGKNVIPHLLKRNNIIWDRALCEITGNGLSSLDYNTTERLNYWKKWSAENGY